MLGRLNGLVEAAMRVIVVSSMVVLVGCVFLQVFSRYVLKSSVPWTEELARYALVYLTFSGAALAIRTGTNIRVDFVVEALPPRVRFLAGCVSDVLVAGVSLMLIWYGGRFAYLSRSTLSPALETSMAWVNGALPVAGILFLIWSVASFVERVTGPRNAGDHT